MVFSDANFAEAKVWGTAISPTQVGSRRRQTAHTPTVAEQHAKRSSLRLADACRNSTIYAQFDHGHCDGAALRRTRTTASDRE